MPCVDIMGILSDTKNIQNDFAAFLCLAKKPKIQKLRDVLNGHHCEQHQKADKPSLCMTGSVMMEKDKACDCHIL